MAQPIWPLPPAFPPQDGTGPAYNVVAHITYQGRILTLQPGNLQLERQGTLFHANHTNPAYGSSWFRFNAAYLPSGRCRLWVRLPAFEDVYSFSLFADPMTGALVSDATWPGVPVTPLPRVVIVRVEIPADVKCRLMLSVACPEDGVASVIDGHAWAGDVPLVVGPAPGVPPEHERFFRGSLPPGTPRFRFEHPRYTVPQFPVDFAANANVLLAHVNLIKKPAPDPPPVPSPFVILGANGFMEVGEVREFSTNLPSHAWMVEWSWTPNALFTPVQFAHTLMATRGGLGTVTARYKTATATVDVIVRGGSIEEVSKPIDWSAVVTDPWVGGRVVRGEILCELHENTSDDAARTLFSELRLIPVGRRRGNRYQLSFDPSIWTLEALVARLSSDSRVALCCPHAIGSWSERRTAPIGIPPHFPEEDGGGLPAGKLWYLGKMEAQQAFGVLRTIERRQQTVVFPDEGIWVFPDGQTHRDFHDRISLAYCQDFSKWVVKPATMRELHHPGDGADPPHGTLVISAAAAAWDNGPSTGLGLDPTILIALLKCDASINQLDSALLKAAEWIGPDLKIVNITLNASLLRLTGVFNLWLTKAFQALIKRGALIVVSAGNYDTETAHVVVASIKKYLTDYQRSHIVIVGGTMPTEGPPLDPHGPETRWVSRREKGGSDYDRDASVGMVDIAAPASSIKLSGFEHSGYASDGTSFATPMVSAAAAIIFSILPNATAPDVKKMLMRTTDAIRYVHFSPDNPTPRLWSPPDRYIGTGRLNLWQAVLRALNKKAFDDGSPTRYIGLRTTADREGLLLSLDYGDDVIEQIPQRSVWNHPSRTEALRFTFTNAAGRRIPRAIVARASQDAPELWRRPLPWRPKEIDALSPKHVVSTRMFTEGAVGLQLDHQPPGNRLRLRVKNLGHAPIDKELLDPKAWNPEDPSFKPWMRLAAGDAFALKAEVIPFPAGTRVTIQRASGEGLPEEDVHDEKRSFVIVPFPTPGGGPPWPTEDLHVTVTFPADAVPAQATLTVNAISLNNYAAEATEHIRFVPQRAELQIRKGVGFLFGPARWWREAEFELRNIGGAKMEGLLSYTTAPLNWSYGAGHGVSLDPGESVRYFDRFGPRETVPPGTANRWFMHPGSVKPLAPGVDYTLSFDTVIAEPPNVEFVPNTLSADHVRSDPWYPDRVFAEWAVTLVNRSTYGVLLHSGYWLVTGTTSPAPPSIAVLNFFNAGHGGALKPGEEVNVTIRATFPRTAVQPPSQAPPVGKYLLIVLLRDPRSELIVPPVPPPPDSDDYRAAPVTLEVVLKLLD